MLRNAERSEKSWIMHDNFFRHLTGVKITEQAGDGLDDERIRIAAEEAFAIAELRNEPEFGEAAGNQIFLPAQFRRERWMLFGLFHQIRQPILAIFKGGELRGELNLLFREVHGAEGSLSFRTGIFAGRFRLALNRRFFTTLVLVARFAAWFVTPGFIAARSTGRLLLRLLATRRLDAAQRPAQFVNLPFVSQFLAFGDFDEFQHFVEMINHLLERRGHFRGVFDGLTDGRSFSGAKIGRLDPRFGALRLRAAFGAAFFRAAIARLLAWGCFRSLGWFRRSVRFCYRFGIVSFNGFRFMGGKISRRFGMGFAEITGRIGFMLGVVGMIHRLGWSSVWLNRFWCRGNFSIGGGIGWLGSGTWATAAASTTTPATAAIG